MKKNKKYICIYDNGINYGQEFEFYSIYRANSKNNINDAKKYAKKLGYNIYKIINIYKY